MKRWCGTLLSLMLVAGFVCGERIEGAEAKLSGTMFGDYYYVVSGASEKENGFLVRRIYLTYDTKWDDHFSGRIRLEANDAGFGKGQKMQPFVKNAYLKYKQGVHQVAAGLTGTPTFSVSESMWGYRSVEKTLMDLHKIASSADLGVDYQATLGAKDQGRLRLMLGNGAGQASEEDNGKKIYGLLHLNPKGAYQVAFIADHEWKSAGLKHLTFSGQAGRTGKDLHGGVEGFVRESSEVSPGVDNRAWGFAGYLSGKVSEKAGWLGRIDFFDPSDQATDDGEWMAIGGVDLMPRPDIHLIPNIVYTHFQDPAEDAAATLRMTLHLDF